VLFKPVTIDRIHQETKGFKTFVFKEGHGINYQAGQYLTFVHHTELQELRRSYSIVSAPLLGEPLTIGVKRIENGAYSRFLIDRASPGDQLMTTGAGGLFTLPSNIADVKKVFFLAAGSGITPILPLLKTCLHIHTHVAVVLLYSNPSPSGTAFLDLLTSLQASFANRFHLGFYFGDTHDLRRARLNRESLSERIHDEFRDTKRDEALFYICGPESYMRMCTYTLQELGFPRDNIKRENFIIDRIVPARPSPPDKESRMVDLHYDGHHYRLKVEYPESILQAAKKQGIELPYSCETGRCGNCAARCVSGKVWLSYNEVLTDKELQSGLTLTCVGHPAGTDVSLVI
jgi:ferredoxin-NADP reductase